MNRWTTNRRSLARATGGLILAAGLALACTDTPTGPPPTYTVGGTVSGLAGSGLVLRDNDGDDLPVSADGSFAFATELAGRAAYSVTVFVQPSSPAQQCTVTAGSGTMANTNVTTVAIACAPNAYTVGGTVSGLVGSGLVLLINDGDSLLVIGDGPVTFATPLSSGTAYSVRVFDQPVIPAQTCVVTDGSGMMARANITTVAIVCVTNAGTGAVRVTASTAGLDAPTTDIVHFDGQSGSDHAVVPANGAVSFDLVPGALTVRLTVAPNCTVTSPNGVTVTVTSGAAVNVAFSVTCVANGTLRVTVATTGPPATTRVFVDPPLSPPPYSVIVSANGTASFAVASGYHTVSLQVARNCTVTGSNSVPVTVAAGALTTVAFSVTCAPLGTMQVTVATTGTDAPATYLVTATVIWNARPSYTQFVPSNGTISFHMVPGGYAVKLAVPLNCTVTSTDDVPVSLTSGAITDLGFTVACH